MASSNGFVAGAISGKYLSSISCTINDNKITNLPSNALVITLGGNTDAWTLDTGNGLIGATSVKNLAIDSGTTTWKISFENNNAIIYNTNESYGRFLYNVDSPRFLVYTSNTSDKMLLVQLYKYVD